MSAAGVDSFSQVSFTEVVENVRLGRPEGLEGLYTVFRMFGGSLRRQMGFQEYDDRMHDIFILVVNAIREGKLREPDALPSYIHGVARFSVYSKMGIRARRQRLSGHLRHFEAGRTAAVSPEERLAHNERLRIMRDMLTSLSDRERQVLTRFYLHEQSKEQICRELNITETQFRLTKSRAKQRLERRGAEELQAA